MRPIFFGLKKDAEPAAFSVLFPGVEVDSDHRVADVALTRVGSNDEETQQIAYEEFLGLTPQQLDRLRRSAAMIDRDRL